MALILRDATGRKLRYVYDGKVSTILSIPVLTEDVTGNRYIYLFDGEAQYYADQGTLGDVPVTDLTSVEVDVIQQYTGAPLTGTETPDPVEPTDIDRSAYIDQPLIIDTTPTDELTP